MQRIAIVSDTHWDRWDLSDPFAEALLRGLDKGFQEIWHGGDVVHETVLQALEQIAPVICVKGNCDTFFDRNLPHSVRRQIEGTQIGRIHGHTHKRRYEEHRTSWGSCTIINPGSVTSPRGGEEPGFGELVINGPAWSYRRHNLLL